MQETLKCFLPYSMKRKIKFDILLNKFSYICIRTNKHEHFCKLFKYLIFPFTLEEIVKCLIYLRYMKNK